MNDGMVAEDVPPPPRAPERSALEAERRHLWGLCYRMTGSASDADDLVQETFIRAMERPPADATRPLRPWLVRVAVNLAKDHLRQRKRRGYDGIWLPTPIESAEFEYATGKPEEEPEARYDAMESASFAFLVALEALSPKERAVLLLRDAFDYSSGETSDALQMSEENVRVTLHRARKAMETYDQGRARPSPERTRLSDELLRNLLGKIAVQDFTGAAALFSERPVHMGDGGGVHHAGRKAVHGAEKISRMYGKLATKRSDQARFSIRQLSGMPALVTDDPGANKPNAPRAVLLLDMDAAGRIRAVYSVLAPAKLGRIQWPARDASS
ncbi:MAG TPA: sigma-70 family RNA polymerase sigma factor [Polyangiaceae bacterium]|nr:sigma-70 family RNA polymerase sigma factor [Polyangiaceae bacterium]